MNYTIRVVLDAPEDIARDISIDSRSTFLELHATIQQAFEFDNSQMASFFMSDENWSKGQEVTLMKMDFDDGSSSKEMSDTILIDLLEKQGDKMVYVFDFMLMWCFYVELLEITPSKSQHPPKIIRSIGKSPYQYSKKIDLDPKDDKHLLKNKHVPSADDLLEEFKEELGEIGGSEFEPLPDDL